MIVSKLASAIYNDIQGGLSGYEATVNMSLELLEDEVVEERMSIIKLYSMKNLIPKKDLTYSINCIKLDCACLDKCCKSKTDECDYGKPVAHFEIPLIMNDFGEESIEYIGAVDKSKNFKVYTNPNFRFHKYRMRNKLWPFIYIDTTPNDHNYYDGYVFNAPLLEVISIIAIFKDPRQVAEYMEEHGCCAMSDADNFTWIATEVKLNLIKKKLNYYRLLYPQPVPNDQVPK